MAVRTGRRNQPPSGRAGRGSEGDATALRREQLLAAATKLFVEKGYDATGVDEIGESVGITGPGLYRHFPNKQAILEAACIAGIERFLASVRATTERVDDAPQVQLRRLIGARVEFALTENLSLTLTLRDQERRHLSGYAQRRIAAMEDLYKVEWMRVLVLCRPKTPAAELQTALIASHLLIGSATRLIGAGHQPESVRIHLERMALAVLNA